MLRSSSSQGGVPPPIPRNGLPCDCPPGQGLSGNKTARKCLPCDIGQYGSGGETINNWKDWTNNGTVPPEGSDIITYCEVSRSYIKGCEAWKASGKHNKLFVKYNSVNLQSLMIFYYF